MGWSLLLDVGCWHNLGWQVEPFSEVVEALRGEGVVVVLPGELGLDVASGGERLKGFDDLGRGEELVLECRILV